MLLAEWKDGFDPPIVAYIASRLAALGAKENAALYSRPDGGNLRALVATDVALFDCRYVEIEGTTEDPIARRHGFEVRVTSWDDVPPPEVVFTSFVNTSGIASGTERARLALKGEPSFFDGKLLTAEDLSAVQEFTRALMHLRHHRSGDDDDEDDDD